MSESEFRELLQKGWRRPWTPEERAQLGQWLQAHPQESLDLDAEHRLDTLLSNLPQPAVSSNFTSLVLQAARRDQEQSGVVSGLRWRERVSAWFHRPLARFASLAAAVVVVWAGFHQVQLQSQGQVARAVALLSVAGELPEGDSVEDFEAIRQLSQVQPPVDPLDDELFVALSAINR